MTSSLYKYPRLWLALGIFSVILLGLASRKFPSLFPAAFGKYPGDALWALMVFIGIAFIKPGIRSLRLAGFALGVCYLVEFSQLYQAPWINAIRATTLGHLVLGSTFNSVDLLAYTLGIAFGFYIDVLVIRRVA